MVYGRTPPSYLQHSQGPGAVSDGVHVPLHDIEAHDNQDDRDPSSNVASAYVGSQNPLNPLSCFKQANQCLQQQHYLDPKYHGAGSTVAQMIQERTGDENVTKKIIQITLIAICTAFVLVLLFAVFNEMETINTAQKPPASASESVERTEETPAFKPEDIQALMNGMVSREKARPTKQRFDAKYGKGKADELLEQNLGKDKLQELMKEWKGTEGEDVRNRHRGKDHDQGGDREDDKKSRHGRRDDRDDRDDREDDTSRRHGRRESEDDGKRRHGRRDEEERYREQRERREREVEARARRERNAERNRYRERFEKND